MRIYHMLLVLLFFSFGCKTPTIEAKTSYVTKSIKDFGATGNGVTNDHQAFILAAQFFNARKGNGKLIIPNGQYKVGYQKKQGGIYKGTNLFILKGCSNFKIAGGANAQIIYKDAIKYGTFMPNTNKAYTSKEKIVRKREYLSTVGNAIYFVNCSSIEMSGVKFNGNSDKAIKGGRFGDKGIQSPYSGLSILDGQDILIEQCSFTNFGLDGIYISTSANSTLINDITIKNTSCEYNGRQGLSVVGGTGIKVVNCKFNYTGNSKFTSSPMAGIDIEPNAKSKARDIVINNCEMINNKGVGFLSMHGDARNITVSNSIMIGKYNWSSRVQKPQFTFSNCKFYGSIVHGYNAKNNLDRTKYISCYFSDTTFRTRGKYLANLSSGYNQFFENCTFRANTKKVIYHRTARSANSNLYTTFKGCNFWVNTKNFRPKTIVGIIGRSRLINNTFSTSEGKALLGGKHFRFEHVIGGETNVNRYGIKTNK